MTLDRTDLEHGDADVEVLDPVGARDDDPAPTPPRNVAEAVLALEDAHAVNGQYPDDLVDVLLEHLDAGAEAVAEHERERYAAHLRVTARGRALAEGTRAGLRLAATHLERNLARGRGGA